MIITRIIGGLGNQMFQYAAARCLAHLHDVELKLDVSSFEDYKLRNFDLMKFNVQTSFATSDEIKEVRPENILLRAWQRLLPVSRRIYYKEPFFHFDKGFHSAGKSVYLKGYWQSEKYFSPIRNIIREELSFKPEIIENLKGYLNILKGSDSVSVHIRRGDYTNAETLKTHGVIPFEFYRSAIQILQQKFPDCRIYFFSDDPKWLREYIKVENSVFVSGEISKNHYEDFYLMSQCHHNIIANSSFSWWAAWLNDHPQKIVIAPKVWFNQGPKDTQDLVPDSWITL